MERGQLEKYCLVARHMEERMKNDKYYTEKSLDNLSDFIDRAEQALPWSLTNDAFRSQYNWKKEAKDKIGKRFSLKTEKARRELHKEVAFAFGMALSLCAGALYNLIKETNAENEDGPAS
jgi:hypothetical protein